MNPKMKKLTEIEDSISSRDDEVNEGRRCCSKTLCLSTAFSILYFSLPKKFDIYQRSKSAINPIWEACIYWSLISIGNCDENALSSKDIYIYIEIIYAYVYIVSWSAYTVFK